MSSIDNYDDNSILHCPERDSAINESIFDNMSEKSQSCNSTVCGMYGKCEKWQKSNKNTEAKKETNNKKARNTNHRWQSEEGCLCNIF